MPVDSRLMTDCTEFISNRIRVMGPGIRWLKFTTGCGNKARPLKYNQIDLVTGNLHVNYDLS